MTHPAVYGIAIAVGVVACIFTFFKNRQQPYGHGGPPAPGPPPPYDYPTKEKRSNTKKRAPENDTSPRADIRHHSPPPPYEHSPTRQVENSNLRNRRPQNDTSQTPPQRVERNIRNEAAGFSGSPHFLNENNSTNNILSIDEPITSRTPMQPERGNSAAVSPTSDNSGNFEHILENNSNSGSFEELNIYNCAICTGLIDQESPKQTVPCKHNFHLRCITEHLRVSQNCPWCGVGIRSLNF